MKKIFRLGIAVLLIVCSVGFVFFFEFFAKEKIDTVPVVMAKENIGFKELITKDNVEIVNVRKSTQIENALTEADYQSIIGKYASVGIKKGTQIYAELIDTYDLVPDETKGEFVAALPSNWLYAVPGSLRRTFIADIYVIGDEQQKIINSIVEESDGEPTEEQLTSGISNTKPILTDVRVASVKDSSNQEVQETGTISNLEIIANEEMLNTMKQYIQQGYKLYVVYKFHRGSDEANE